MITFTMKYARISPAVLASRIERDFDCLTRFHDVDEEHFEMSVFYCKEIDELWDFLAEYLD